MTAWSGCANALLVYTMPRVRVLLPLGFSAGLPYLLVFSTLSAWLTEAGFSRTVIGLFSFVGITYSIKVLWAPLLDHLSLPFLTNWLGRRRAWMLAAQCGVALGLTLMAATEPVQNPAAFVAMAVLVALSSATQDVAIDAWRIESAAKEYQAAMAAMYIFGYRLALLIAGAGAFYAAEFWSWPHSYMLMAGLMSVGIITVAMISEPATTVGTSPPYSFKKSADSLTFATWFRRAVIGPFADFFQRNSRFAWQILAFIAIYRISDITMGVMANPFYLDMGYSKIQIAQVTKFFGFFMTLIGAALGGVLVLRFGMMRILIAGAALAVVTNLLFVALSVFTPSTALLAAVISADNLSGGIAITVFIAYLSSLTQTAYTATQYALFSSLMTLPAKLLGGASGAIVDSYGYTNFFIYAAVLGIPAIALAAYLARHCALQNRHHSA